MPIETHQKSCAKASAEGTGTIQSYKIAKYIKTFTNRFKFKIYKRNDSTEENLTYREFLLENK